VLVEGDLTPTQVRRSAWITLAAGVCMLLAVASLSQSFFLPVLTIGGLLTVIAFGYTAPPLRLVYRTVGEIDVALTHSLGALLCGYVFHGGAWSDPAPYLVSLPLFLGILPAIILAGVPDRDADGAVGKRTIAVRAGSRAALVLALICTAATAVAAVLIETHAVWSALYGTGVLLLVAYAVWLMALFGRRLRRGDDAGGYDGLIAASLGYTSLVAMVPLLALI
jgi:1,4-dihydroxy-2-naphthoate polyprenyltransferase